MFAGAVWSIEEPIMKNSELRISAIRERAAASQLNQYGEQYLVDLISLVDTQVGPDADTVVEFGTGVSTLILSEALSQRNQTAGTAPVLLSIHHVGDRQREVASALHCWPFLHLRTHELSSTMESRVEAGFDYATSPYLLHRWVDLAYVGGAVRANCVLAIVPILKDGGSIILNQAEHQGHQFLDGYFERAYGTAIDHRLAIVGELSWAGVAATVATAQAGTPGSKSAGADFRGTAELPKKLGNNQIVWSTRRASVDSGAAAAISAT